MSALQWLLWWGSALSRMLVFLNKRARVFVLTKLSSSRFILDLLLSHFYLLVSNDSLIFFFYIFLLSIMFLGVANWVDHEISGHVLLHLNFGFPSLLLCVQMMLNFEFCYYFYLVLVELFQQGISIFHMLVLLWLTQ